MRIVKLDATDSTNAHLKHLMRLEPLEDYTTVATLEQSAGRGQMGSVWISERGKNLLVSVLKKFDQLPIKLQFYLNIAVSLAIFDTLKYVKVPDLSIKWPNDILSGDSKLCGILIENIVSGDQISASIIGVGLNVNQTTFTDLPNATSLKLLLGHDFELDGLLQDFLYHLQQVFQRMDEEGRPALIKQYTEHLYKKGVESTFMTNKGASIVGIIKGISEEGKLIVQHQDHILVQYAMKEVRIIY